MKAPRGADGAETEPQAGAPFLDSFAIDGDSVPKTPEDWVLIACSMNRFGQYNVDGSGNPTGPTIMLRTIAPPGLTSAVRPVDAPTVDTNTVKDGKVIATSRIQISADGKTLTETATLSGQKHQVVYVSKAVAWW